MALSVGLKGTAFRIAQSLAANMAAGFKFTDLRDSVAAKMGGGFNGSELLSMLNVVRQAHASAQFGQGLDANPTGAASAPPCCDHNANGPSGHYAYRVRVDATDVNTLESSSRVVVITSPVPLTGQQLAAAARAEYEDDPTGNGIYPGAIGAERATAITTNTISAGRIP